MVGLPLEWSESQNVAWKVPVPGLGWSSPVVGRRPRVADDGDQAIRGRRRFALLAFDVASGRELVNVEVFRVRGARAINPKNSWASPTPIVDGDRVYVHFGAEGTAALTTTGERSCGRRASRTSRSTAAADRRCCYGGSADLQLRRQRRTRSSSRSMRRPGR